MPERINLLDVHLNATTKEELLPVIDAATADAPVRIATVNPEFILEAIRNPVFRSCLEEMPYCTIDGSGAYQVLRAGKLLGHNRIATIERYAGADLVEDLFARYADGSKRFFLVGSTTEVLQTAQKVILEKYPTLNIVGYHWGGKLDKRNPQLLPDVKAAIQSAEPDIILVTFGAPKQELWMQAAAGTLSVPVMVGVGGTLRFYGSKKRAPQWVRAIHLEWLFRAFTEPNHWPRVFKATVVFPIRSLYWLLRD